MSSPSILPVPPTGPKQKKRRVFTQAEVEILERHMAAGTLQRSGDSFKALLQELTHVHTTATETQIQSWVDAARARAKRMTAPRTGDASVTVTNVGAPRTGDASVTVTNVGAPRTGDASITATNIDTPQNAQNAFTSVPASSATEARVGSKQGKGKRPYKKRAKAVSAQDIAKKRVGHILSQNGELGARDTGKINDAAAKLLNEATEEEMAEIKKEAEALTALRANPLDWKLDELSPSVRADLERHWENTLREAMKALGKLGRSIVGAQIDRDGDTRTFSAGPHGKPAMDMMLEKQIILERYLMTSFFGTVTLPKMTVNARRESARETLKKALNNHREQRPKLNPIRQIPVGDLVKGCPSVIINWPAGVPLESHAWNSTQLTQIEDLMRRDGTGLVIRRCQGCTGCVPASPAPQHHSTTPAASSPTPSS